MTIPTTRITDIRKLLAQSGYRFIRAPTNSEIRLGIRQWLAHDGINKDLGTKMSRYNFSLDSLLDTGNRPGIVKHINQVLESKSWPLTRRTRTRRTTRRRRYSKRNKKTTKRRRSSFRRFRH